MKPPADANQDDRSTIVEPIPINSRESVYLDDTNPTDSIGWVLHIKEPDGYEDAQPCSVLTAARETGAVAAVMRETEAAIDRQVERIADAASAGEAGWIVGMAMALADLVCDADVARRTIRRGPTDLMTLAEASRRAGKRSDYYRMRKHRCRDFPEPAGLVNGYAGYDYAELTAWNDARLKRERLRRSGASGSIPTTRRKKDA